MHKQLQHFGSVDEDTLAAAHEKSNPPPLLSREEHLILRPAPFNGVFSSAGKKSGSPRRKRYISEISAASSAAGIPSVYSDSRAF